MAEGAVSDVTVEIMISHRRVLWEDLQAENPLHLGFQKQHQTSKAIKKFTTVYFCA
jgi:hypothetical protein